VIEPGWRLLTNTGAFPEHRGMRNAPVNLASSPPPVGRPCPVIGLNAVPLLVGLSPVRCGRLTG
jgi:hypothetical protein